MMNFITKKRVKAFLIDLIFLVIIYIVISVFFIINTSYHYLFMHSLSSTIVLGLFFCKDVFNGQSIGKRIMKLQVVDNSNAPACLKNIIKRNIFILHPFDAITIISNGERRLGDQKCKTKVVDTNTCKVKYRNSIAKVSATVAVVLLIACSFSCLIWIVAISIYPIS